MGRRASATIHNTISHFIRWTVDTQFAATGTPFGQFSFRENSGASLKDLQHDNDQQRPAHFVGDDEERLLCNLYANMPSNIDNSTATAVACAQVIDCAITFFFCSRVRSILGHFLPAAIRLCSVRPHTLVNYNALGSLSLSGLNDECGTKQNPRIWTIQCHRIHYIKCIVLTFACILKCVLAAHVNTENSVRRPRLCWSQTVGKRYESWNFFRCKTSSMRRIQPRRRDKRENTKLK